MNATAVATMRQRGYSRRVVYVRKLAMQTNRDHQDWNVVGDVDVGGDVVAFVDPDTISLEPGDVLIHGDVIVTSGDITAFSTDPLAKIRGTLYATGDVIIQNGDGKKCHE